MPTHHRQEKIESIIQKAAGKFVRREAGGQSLITITRVIYNTKANQANILFTVYPDHKIGAVSDFLKRNIEEFKEYMKTNTSLGRIPFVKFNEDFGEKNRQKIDDLSLKQ